MRSRYLLAICGLFLGMVLPALKAGDYPLTDGQTVIGEPISYSETGLIIRQSDGIVSTRIPWTKFTQSALTALAAEAKAPKDKAYVEPFIEEVAEKEAKKKEIVIKQVELPVRPTGDIGFGAGFSSPLFVTILIILYFANIYGAFEIAFFKNQPAWMVCGMAAVAPVVGPLVFLCIPGRRDAMALTTMEAPAPFVEEVVAAGDSTRSTGNTTLESGENAAESVPATPTFPDPIIFRRGEFSFNRRFFETKLAGFFRLVPGEAEKDLVVAINSLRGNFVGKRITRVTQEQLYLQVFKEEATHDEMIPFTEVNEVIIRHKDAV
jgi:hypothetical protein